MEQRVSLITWGVGDLGRSRAFYEGLGWRGQEVDETVFFAAGGLALVLWGRDKLAGDAGIVDDGVGTFGGIVLAHNVRSGEEVDRMVGGAAASGGVATEEPGETFCGGYAGYLRDPDGHAGELAHNPGSDLDDDGARTLPTWRRHLAPAAPRLSAARPGGAAPRRRCRRPAGHRSPGR